MNSNRFLLRLLLATTIAMWWMAGAQGIAQTDVAVEEAQPTEETHRVSWLHSFDEAMEKAGARRAPVLLIFGATWCGPCKMLDAEIEKAAVQSELERWVPVHVDVDEDDKTAERFAITSIPALRILSPDGRQLAGQEGVTSAVELAAWLQQHYATAVGETTPTASPEKLTSVSVRRVLKDFSSREPTVRESAISRVVTVPQFAAADVVSEFSDASLAERLAYLEVLTAWEAPVDGLDPWIPESVTAERISALEEWVTKKEFPKPDAEASLTAAEIIETRRLLRLLVQADRVEAAALREQLARMGPKVLPLIREQMTDEVNDDIRAKLASARYRVAASDKIVTDWPEGIEQLASVNYEQRIAAMKEFSKRAGATDEQLLGELVADPVPVIREIALSVLAKVDGGRANGPLLKMLDDPDSNVRAAVLKTLSENASASIVPAITDYIAREQDIDLIVHAVRCLRAVNNTKASLAMLPLLEHASWRIRAEVVESLGVFVEAEVQRQSSSSASSKEDSLKKICAAIVKRLGDEDGFVVGKVIAALSEGYRTPPVSVPDVCSGMDAAVVRHPELARTVFRFAVGRDWIGEIYEKNLQQFFQHERPVIRAAAIASLVRLQNEAAFPQLTTAFEDDDSSVRISALDSLATVIRDQVQKALREELQNMKPEPDTEAAAVSGDDPQPAEPAMVDRPSEGNLLSDALESISGIFSGPVGEPDSAFDRPSEALSSSSESPPRYSAESRDTAFEKVVGGRAMSTELYEFEPALGDRFQNGTEPERLAAARCLSMLGHADSLEYVLKTTDRPNQIGVTEKLLVVWSWDKRQRLFHHLQSIAEAAHDRIEIADAMAEDQDPRAADEIWAMLADEQLAVSDAVSMITALWTSYSNKSFYEVDEAGSETLRVVNEDSRRMIMEGIHWQPLLGLILQNYTKNPELAELAGTIVPDESRAVDLRCAALQFQLIGMQPTKAKELALSLLAGSEPRLAGIALRFLSLGSEAIVAGAGGFEIQISVESYASGSSGTPSPIVLSPPEGLTIEMLQSTLKNVSADEAVYVAHLLTLLKNFDEMPRIIEYWRRTPDDPAAQKLLYQAVTASNDSKYVPVLEELYAELVRSEVTAETMSDFYWTVRTMSGPEIIALRKQIREEQGESQLRQR